MNLKVLWTTFFFKERVDVYHIIALYLIAQSIKWHAIHYLQTRVHRLSRSNNRPVQMCYLDFREAHALPFMHSDNRSLCNLTRVNNKRLLTILKDSGLQSPFSSRTCNALLYSKSRCSLGPKKHEEEEKEEE